MKDKLILNLKNFLIKYRLKFIFVFLKKIHYLLIVRNNIFNYLLNAKKILNYKNELKKYKNKYKDKRCFILGAAPSINNFDLSKLNSEYVFTVNKGHKLKELGLNKSNFHVITDSGCLRELNSKDLCFSEKYFFSTNLIPKTKNFTFFKLKNENKFQNNILEEVYVQSTVICPVIQIASYMGFKDIYLLGIDLSFDKNNSHFYKESRGEKFRNLNSSIENKVLMYNWILKSSKILEKNSKKLINLSPVENSLPKIKKSSFKKLFN